MKLKMKWRKTRGLYLKTGTKILLLKWNQIPKKNYSCNRVILKKKEEPEGKDNRGTITSIIMCKVPSTLREEGGKAKCTFCSLVTSVKFKLNHLAYLVESQDLERPGWQICLQMCGIWPWWVGYDSDWDCEQSCLWEAVCWRAWLAFSPSNMQFKLEWKIP